MHETQCQDQMWEIRHLSMLATVRIGEQSRGLARKWSSGNSEGSLREFAANKIRLPGMYKIPRANKTSFSLSPQLGWHVKPFSCDVVSKLPFVTLTCPRPVAAWLMG